MTLSNNLSRHSPTVNRRLWISISRYPCVAARYARSSLLMVSLETHLRKARRARWANKTKKEKKAAASKASRAYWDALTPKQRSAKMKRRAAKRKKLARRGKVVD